MAMASRIAAQLYTVREHTKTIDNIARTCQRVRAMGYEAVEAAALGAPTTQRLCQRFFATMV